MNNIVRDKYIRASKIMRHENLVLSYMENDMCFLKNQQLSLENDLNFLESKIAPDLMYIKTHGEHPPYFDINSALENIVMQDKLLDLKIAVDDAIARKTYSH